MHNAHLKFSCFTVVLISHQTVRQQYHLLHKTHTIDSMDAFFGPFFIEQLQKVRFICWGIDSGDILPKLLFSTKWIEISLFLISRLKTHSFPFLWKMWFKKPVVPYILRVISSRISQIIENYSACELHRQKKVSLKTQCWEMVNGMQCALTQKILWSFEKIGTSLYRAVPLHFRHIFCPILLFTAVKPEYTIYNASNSFR